MNQPEDPEQGEDVNPFTADLANEMNLEEDGGGVAQVFNEGKKTSRIVLIVAIAVILVAGGAFYYFTMEDEYVDEDFIGTEEDNEEPEEGLTADEEIEEAAEEPPLPEAEIEEAAVPEAPVEQVEAPVEEPIEEFAEEPLESSAPVAEPVVADIPRMVAPSPGISPQAAAALAPTPAKNAPSNLKPVNGAQRFYDESSEWALFSWDGGPAWITISRSPSMTPIALKKWAKKGLFHVRRPYPGTWHWQVSNKLGKSEVRSFTILPPIKRDIKLIAPLTGATIAGEGGTISWTGDTRITHYRVEISNSGWESPTYVFATSATQKNISQVAPGAYQLRLGAFSEVSGKWEYTDVVDITVQ